MFPRQKRERSTQKIANVNVGNIIVRLNCYVNSIILYYSRSFRFISLHSALYHRFNVFELIINGDVPSYLWLALWRRAYGFIFRSHSHHEIRGLVGSSSFFPFKYYATMDIRAHKCCYYSKMPKGGYVPKRYCIITIIVTQSKESLFFQSFTFSSFFFSLTVFSFDLCKNTQA